ncbi:MAG: DUF2806 domain-containing protein [Gammaproteobacteria bacterium]|nr:DUF2806 domain-containing protein [Gammaproteobacteria bacterium]MCW8840224.1 DUF2806 domain-containing protein [Gammaproteobacteria bacterium]MCW8958764.1 DUF2806 domain-containing protein [Gammaproteobacteria bacterium]MCW8973175.1 DUF2806 domain-containing protein [Gammaproteobacteria bacterium]MCW8991923.1 DUF2806 domain-containing protein [Gammaproteobacteria bacterium]
MEIKDLAGLSQPLTKLIEVVSSGVGAVSQPYIIAKNAEAKAKEIRAISNALHEVADKHQLPVTYNNGQVEVWQKPEDKTLVLDSSSSGERAALRVDYQERKRQSNIESVTSAAAIELANSDDVPNEELDEDWITRFFNSAQDVSSEQMQEIWGRILAGEIKRPGQYSLKTLDFLKNLTKKDATQIEKVCKLALRYHHMSLIGIKDKKWLEEQRSIVPGDHFALGELGVLYPTDLRIRLFRTPDIEEDYLLHGSFILSLKRGEIKSEVSLPMWKFTVIGTELLSLLPPSDDIEYLRQIGKFFVSQKGKATLGVVNKRLPNGQINFQIIEEISNDPTPSENKT